MLVDLCQLENRSALNGSYNGKTDRTVQVGHEPAHWRKSHAGKLWVCCYVGWAEQSADSNL